MSTTDGTDVIERSISVTSSIDRTWEALTSAEGLARWFGDSAEVDLRVGGTVRFGWSQFDETADGVIEEVDPPHAFAYRWNVATDEDGTEWTTLVRFTLSTSDGATVVTVVESGLSALPSELRQNTIDQNSEGWSDELGDLARLLGAVDAG